MVSLSIGYRTHAANMYLEQRVANWIILSILAVGVPSGLCRSKTLYHEPFKQDFQPPSGLRQDALFGYSVTYQPVGTSGRLIIGAPKADNIGQVYTCDLSRQTCFKISCDLSRDPNIVHDYWLGATVMAGSKFFLGFVPLKGNKGTLIRSLYGLSVCKNHFCSGTCGEIMLKNKYRICVQTCAPRLVKHESSDPNKIGTFSQCYYQNADDLYGQLHAASMVSLPKDGKKFEDTQTSYGWSMDVGEDDTIAVGGPVGSGGRVMVYSSSPISTPTLIDTSMTNGTISYNFGYSIASGKFLTNVTILKAISSTYGDIGKGKVVFFRKATSNYEHIPRMDIVDDQLGSMFGAALCSAWIGATQQSLLVGAPTASSADGKTRHNNLGAVFVYSNIVKKEPRRAIFGQRDGSYFGNAIITIDDLTGDGKDEVAIAAPYEDEGRGAVYLYSGAELFKKDGEITWFQRIVGAAPQQNLGLSLGVLQDFDQNGCNELAIGVPGNNSVVVLSCVNSVTIKLSTVFPSLESQAREVSTRDSSFEFEVSMLIEYPPRMKIIDSEIAVTIDVDHPNATIVGDKTYIVSLKHINQKSDHRKVQVKLPFGGDYVKDIAFVISAKPVIDPYGIPKFNPFLVTLNDKSNRSITRTAKVPVKSNLSFDVSTTLADGYVIGSTATENVTITISNDGYMAYGACAHVRIAGASVLLFPLGCTTDRDHFYCTALVPITKNKAWTAIITLDTKTMTSDSKVVDIRVKLLDHCVKATGIPYENKIKLKTDFEPVLIIGKSDPQSVNVSETMLHRPYFEHVYTITNNGMTTWGELSCNITLPPHVTHSFPKGELVECEKTSELTAFCRIKKLHKQLKLSIGMEIPSYKPFDNPETRNVTIHSEILLQLGDALKFQSINTVVVQVNVTVPLWIIIASAVVGLLILVLMAFALHECGFLQRKNKQKLEVLKERVRRETIRRSQKLRASMEDGSNPQPSDKHKLLKEEDEVASGNNSDIEDRKDTGIVSIDKDIQGHRYVDNQDLLNHLRKRNNDSKVDEKGLTKAEIH